VPMTTDPGVPSRFGPSPSLQQEMSWNFEPAPARGLGIQGCCASRAKPSRVVERSGPVWETADLTWWDFQKRRWSSLWLMKTVYYRLKRVERETEPMYADGGGKCPKADQMWDEVHRTNAREIREHAEQVKGLFIKACQFMSAMAGVLPDPYVDEFMCLTDHLPVSTIEEVRKVIRQDFKRFPRDIFSELAVEPIASASIAQVHKATLRHNGKQVAVKIQHDGVDRIFLEDVQTLSTIAEQVAYWSPDLDFRKFTQEWRESVPHELDFGEEKRALERARKALRAGGSPVLVPKADPKLVSRHVLVMEFIEATPILSLGDVDFCQQNGIDKNVVLETLLDAFGIMAFKDGMFHADPHSGNVRILVDPNAPGGAVPVLFDWGFFREIDDGERMGLAKLFHALANFDIAGLFDVLNVLGFSVRGELFTDEFRREFLEKARSLLKDTVNKQETRANVQREMADYQARVKRGQQRGSNAASNSISPIYFLEEFPRCIIFFMRMLQILRGLCVSVEAQGMPILQIFARHAKEALIEGSKKQSLVNRLQVFAGREVWSRNTVTPPSPWMSTTTLNSPAKIVALEARLKKRLAALLEQQKIVGAQVAVLQGGRSVADVCMGNLSSIDARPVDVTTRFPLFSGTGSLAALALLRTMRRLGFPGGGEPGALHSKVAEIWPEFGGGDSSLTIAEILSHSAGLHNAFPQDFAPRHLDDIAAVADHLEKVPLSAKAETRYAHLLQVFVLAKLGDLLAGEDSLLHWLGTELGALGLDIAAPAGRGGEAAVCRELPDLARVSMTEVNASRDRRLGTLAMEGGALPTQQEDKEPQRSAPGSTCGFIEAVAKNPLPFDPLQANAAHGGVFRAGLSLGASAHALASTLSSEALQDDLEALGALEPAGMDPTAIGWVFSGGATRWTAGGLQALEVQAVGPRGLLGRRRGGYGIVCGFGPCVVHFPDLASGGITIAVTVNDVLRGREAAAELLAEALKSFGYAPTWTSAPVRVLADAIQLSRSETVAPLVQSLGGIRAVKESLYGAGRGNSKAARPSRACVSCCWCGCLAGVFRRRST